MNKLDMAHDWAIKHGDPENFKLSISEAWEYADAMQAEADKREHKHMFLNSEPCVCGIKMQDLANSSTNIGNLVELRGEEWQPDWSQAPDGFNRFVVGNDGGYGFFTNIEPELRGDYYFVGSKGVVFEDHGYIGEWKDSLRKRPE